MCANIKCDLMEYSAFVDEPNMCMKPMFYDFLSLVNTEKNDTFKL